MLIEIQYVQYIASHSYPVANCVETRVINLMLVKKSSTKYQ